MAALVIAVVVLALRHIPVGRASPTYDTSRLLERDASSVAASCTDYKIPLTVTSENYVFNITEFETDFDLIDLVTDFVRKDSSTSLHLVTGTKNETADYSIYGTFCSPKTAPAGVKAGRETTVLIATSGLAYDGRYWQSSYKPSEYSFADAMVAQGYSVFYYDRVGVGKSSRASGYDNQEANQVEVLARLAELLREGKYTGTIGKATSVVAVGHSFGSHVSNRMLSLYPNAVDAAVLTGMAYSAPDYNSKLLSEAVAPRIAAQLSPANFRGLDTGYVVFVDIVSHLNTFFKAPAYELGAVKYAQSIAQPFAITEFFSTGVSSEVAPEFEGPVLVISGEFDLEACSGECYSSFAAKPLTDIFPKSRMPEYYVQPGAGHGANFATNATGFYGAIADFLGRAGF